MDKHFASAFDTYLLLSEPEMSAVEKAHRDEALDEALRCTFPASDPIAISFTSRFRSYFTGIGPDPK